MQRSNAAFAHRQAFARSSAKESRLKYSGNFMAMFELRKFIEGVIVMFRQPPPATIDQSTHEVVGPAFDQFNLALRGVSAIKRERLDLCALTHELQQVMAEHATALATVETLQEQVDAALLDGEEPSLEALDTATKEADRQGFLARAAQKKLRTTPQQIDSLTAQYQQGWKIVMSLLPSTLLEQMQQLAPEYLDAQDKYLKVRARLVSLGIAHDGLDVATRGSF